MRTGSKLFVSFSLVIVLAIMVGGVGIYGMYAINNADVNMYTHNLLPVSAMGEIRECLQRQRVELRNYALHAGDEEKIKETRASMDSLEKDMDALFLQYEAAITDPSLEEAYYNAKKAYLNDFKVVLQQGYEASFRSAADVNDVIFAPATAALTTDMLNSFALSMQNNELWANGAVQNNTALFQQMTILEVVMLAVAVIIAAVLALYITKLIAKPLSVLSAFMNQAGATGDITLRAEDEANIARYSRNKDETGQCIGSTAGFVKHITVIAKELEMVANGDLTTHIDVLSEKDVMGVAMQKVVDSLNDMFGGISASSRQVSIASKQIADGSQTLAQGSTEQASAVEQLSSSISEIARNTKDNAEMADKAAKLAGTIRGNAEKGSRQMDEMTAAVKEINEASHSINKVIKVIDDIASQTNILALNATVEAARAGQHGKGFAVVAEEVRTLAAKSAEAAKDTESLIANSLEKAELGVRIADETAASLGEIVAGINESSKLVQEIARSSEQQSAGVTQINKGIEQVVQVIQQNSATAQESAAASEEMNGQASMLEELISQFKLKDGVMPAGLPRAEKGARNRLPEKSRYEEDGEATGLGKY